MSLFSFFRKNKQESASDDGAFYSRAEEESKAVRSRGKSGKSNRREQPADPVLPEKKRARRRLVGAIALVLAAVIGLPMMFDSEPKPLANDIVIEIPSRDERSPENVESAPATSSDPVEETAPSTVAESTSPVTSPAEPVVSAPQTAAVEPKVERAPVAQPKSAPAPTRTPEVKTTTPAQARTDEGARALALLEGRAAPKSEKKSEKFVIQVGALSTKEKAQELQARLKNAGINSYTQQIATASGPHTRVRVGPFSSREEAEKMQSKIMKLGLNGKLVPA